MDFKFIVLLLCVIVGISNFVISISAIILIIIKDFKDSKIKWIFISMIGIIGPLLWLFKGRKLIVKNKNVC